MIDHNRWAELAILEVLAMLLVGAVPAKAQNYPTRPVTVITPAGAGSAPDVIFRIVADRLTQSWGQPVVIHNRPGGGGLIAVQAASTSERDGYTLFMPISSTFVVLPETQSKMPMDLSHDIVPIGLIGEQPLGFAVHPSLGVSTMPELIALAKERPGEILYGGARGTLVHLTGEMLSRRASIDLRFIPYSTVAKAAQDAIAGTLPLLIDGITSLAGPVQSGSLKALAVTSKKRLPSFPNLPTLAETLPGTQSFEAIGWFVLMAPAGTPDAIIRQVNQDLRKTAEQPEVQQKFEALGTYTRPLSPKETGEFIRSEQNLWRPVVRQVLTTP